MTELFIILSITIGLFIGAIAVELDLRRNLKRDPNIVPFIFGKDVILKGDVMEICEKCGIRFFKGACNCPVVLTLEKLRGIIGGDTMRVIYGHPQGRTDSYYIDYDDLSGYDSSGNYRITPLEELDMDYVLEVSKITTVFRKAKP